LSCAGPLCDEASGCCVDLESCVSCCLALAERGGRFAPVRGPDGARAFVGGEAPRADWNRCVHACRTSSRSVQGNQYKHGPRHCVDVAWAADVLAAEVGGEEGEETETGEATGALPRRRDHSREPAKPRVATTHKDHKDVNVSVAAPGYSCELHCAEHGAECVE